MSKSISKALAEKLVEIYSKRKIPHYSKLYATSPEGFTRERIQSDPQNSLFQMIIVAVYDRQPFTHWAGGFEPIWGLAKSKWSLPRILREAKLYSLDRVLELTESTIDDVLSRCIFYGHQLASYGKTRFAKTFTETAISVNNLISDIRVARMATDVKKYHGHLVDITGIGEIIASKLVMYTLRELPYFGSSINPKELYPAVKPILKEYHNANLAKEFKHLYGENIVDQLFEELKSLGDPFAIDAMYYIDRDAPELKKYILELTTDRTDAYNNECKMGKSLTNKNSYSALSSLPLKRGTVLRGIINTLSVYSGGWLRRDITVYKDDNRVYPKVGNEIILVDSNCKVYQSRFTKPEVVDKVCLGLPANLKPWYKKHYPEDRIGSDRDVYFEYTGCDYVFWIYSSQEWKAKIKSDEKRYLKPI